MVFGRAERVAKPEETERAISQIKRATEIRPTEAFVD